MAIKLKRQISNKVKKAIKKTGKKTAKKAVKNKNKEAGIVYILTNPAMPGVVKIGRTSQDNVSTRLKRLYTTGVPVPFECEYACRINNVAECEKKIHTAFDPNRLNKKREFFKIDPKQAVAILELLELAGATNITTEIKKQANAIDVDRETRSAAIQLKASNTRTSRPTLSFADMGISNGDCLYAERDKSVFLEIIDNKTREVKYNDETISFMEATRRLLNEEKGTPLRPNNFWMYEDKLLTDIFNDYYEDESM